MLQILGRISSINVRKVLWTCDEIGIPYEREDWGAGFRSTQDPAYLALNPNGLVPVIKDDGFVLWESNTICRYLAAKHGRTDLLPGETRSRALVEQWMDWVATELNASWRYAFLALSRKDPAYTDEAQIAASVQRWNKMIGILDRQLASTGPFVTGGIFTLADILIGLSVHRWRMTPMAKPDYPAVAAFYERLSQRPAFMAHGPNGHP
ncbi:MAG: glutathione S-transferase family protein [Dongiaceae bacterium]